MLRFNLFVVGLYLATLLGTFTNQHEENLKASIPSTDFERSKQLENVEYFNCFGSLTANGLRCVLKLNPGLPRQRQHSTKKTLFTSKLDLNLRKKLVKRCIWCVALYGAVTWTFRIIDHKYLKSFKIWCWRRKRIG